MRLIHKNDFCRDIAIWYDEFLSPGENFNDSIRKALQKSGLFVLAVTPNLINETNYIMTTEYPMAKKNGKPILPVELVPTDREQLSEKYEDIPNPTDAHNETVLSETLLESIKNMSIKENDASPEHDFLIGLAYIGGIDVEKDLEIALCCFTNAAENGVMEAMKKLSHMYFYADGTAKDIEKSYFWHRKYIENLVLSFEQTLTTESAIIVSTERLNYALMLESDKLSVLSLSIAEQEYKENIRFYETILNSMSLEKSCKEVYMSELAECYYAIGSFYKWKNYLLQATEYYLRTVGIYEILTDLKHWRYCIKLIQCYEQLFYTYIQLNQIEDAECFVLKRISILEKYSKSEIKTEGKVSNFEWHYKKELADSYHIAGYYYDKINSLDRAVECYVN